MTTTITAQRHRVTFSLDAIPRRNLCELARRTGYTVRTIQRWNTTGIPLHSADQLACHLGLHPANLWPTWYQAP